MNLTKDDLINLNDDFNYISNIDDRKYISFEIRGLVNGNVSRIVGNSMWIVLMSINNITLSNLSN